MSNRKKVVANYIEGFRRTDHAAILDCLTDVVWVIHGYRTLHGKPVFDAEIENDAATGHPELHLDRLVEEGDTVVAVGHGQMTLKQGGPVPFVFTELFTFTGDRLPGLRHHRGRRPRAPSHRSRRRRQWAETAVRSR
jgi:ketosteroid isomerase-like protein